MAGVSVSVGGDATKAFSILQDVQDKASATATKIADGFKVRIGQRLFDGLVQAAKALPTAMKSALDAGGRLSDQMARTGAAGEGLVVMERWLMNAGLAADKTTTLLGLMQKAIAGLNEDSKPTGEAFARLGLSMDALRAMDPTDAFQAIGQAIMAIADPAERTALAMRVFGRSGAEALVAFDDAGGFEAARRDLGSLPSILAENAAGLDTVSDRLGNIGTAWQQLAAAASVAILPALDSITAAIAAVDLGAIGSAIGMLLNGLAAIAPHLAAIGAVMIGLKITAFLAALKDKTIAWWAETAAIKANTAALRENAAAGAATKGAAGKPAATVGRAGMLAGGGVLTIAAIGAQVAMNYANNLAAANAAMEDSFERGHAAAKKFDVAAIRAQAASRAEIEKTVQAIEKEKKAIEEAAEAQMKTVDDPALRERILADTATTTRLLDGKARALRATSAEQLEANAAARAAAEAEAAYRKSIEDSAEAYRKARAEYQRRLDTVDEKTGGKGSLAEQLAELDRAEAAIRAKISDRGSAGDSAAIIRRLDHADAFPGMDRDMEQALKLEALETRRADLAERLAEENEKTRQTKAAAIAEWQEEMRILTATIAGNKDKVKDLEREAAIRAEIARLAGAGFDSENKDIAAAAARLVKAREAAATAATAATARQGNRDTLAEAAALASGAGAMDALNREKRASEIASQSGLGITEARNIAANEADLEKLTALRSQMDGLQFQSTLGTVSDMQRVGGGGGVASSGLDYARQQTENSRQMVTLLGQMLARSPEVTVSDY